jgi:NAD(P)-dependent dehydrogenase (short-subunit alcohol dehydrogenase family)
VPSDHTQPGAVLVTGGASGLGAAVVVAIKNAGGQPFVLDLNPPGPAVGYLVVDLADRCAAEEATRQAARFLGGLDALVTAAGIDACGRLEDVDAQLWERVVRVNLFGTAAVVRAALPFLESSHGRVVTVASTLGLRAVPEATAYCASKFGIVGFTRALQGELAGRVGVTLLVPGGMRTGFFADRDVRYRPGADAQLSEPGDVAAAVLFALSRPPGCEVRELLIAPERETSWP